MLFVFNNILSLPLKDCLTPLGDSVTYAWYMKTKLNILHALEYKATLSIPLGYLETKQNYKNL